MISSVESAVQANGLRHHVVTWAPEGARPDATVLCCHGFLDIGWSWRRVAERLAERGRRVVAFDWRGHGQSEWVGPGGYYYFTDYLGDLADLVEAVVPGRLHLVGHSMGGGAAIQYAGAFADRVERLVILEALGPPWGPRDPPPARCAAWVADVRKARGRRQAPRTFGSIDEVVVRMRRQNPGLPDALGRELAARCTRTVATADGPRLAWIWDPLHRTRGPVETRLEHLYAFMEAVTAPVLYIEGQHGHRWPDQEERLSRFSRRSRVEVPAVGHMLHWFAPEAVADAIDGFLGPP